MLTFFLQALLHPLRESLGVISEIPSLNTSQFFGHAAATPLTQINLNLETLMETFKTKPEFRTETQMIYQTLLHTQHLESLIKVSQHQLPGRRQRFPAKAALEEIAIRWHQPEHGRHLKSALMLDDSVWLPGHAFYFQEILSCLLKNAFEAYSLQQRQKVITLVAIQHPKYLQLYICDQGQGMNWLSSKLATRKGFTVKPAGSGLGLAFVKEVIEKYFKGKFILSSYEEVGTMAMLQLPLKV